MLDNRKISSVRERHAFVMVSRALMDPDVLAPMPDSARIFMVLPIAVPNRCAYCRTTSAPCEGASADMAAWHVQQLSTSANMDALNADVVITYPFGAMSSISIGI